jgi:hypothetical protein
MCLEECLWNGGILERVGLSLGNVDIGNTGEGCIHMILTVRLLREGDNWASIQGGVQGA